MRLSYSNSLNTLITFLLFFCCASLFSQGIVEGTVVTADGNTPIPGVIVMLNNTTQGTVTDENGKFSIQAKTGGVLRFSSISLKPREWIVTDYLPVSVTMDEDSKYIDDVVVTALGVKKEIKLIGYFVQEVEGENYNMRFSVSLSYQQSNIPNMHLNIDVGPGTGNGGRIAKRFRYFSSEETVNKENYQAEIQSHFGGNDDINGVMWLLQ